jgi:cystathionine gamma-synthase
LGDHFETGKIEYKELESGRSITPESVFLFSCGMAAIYFSHQIVRELYHGLKTVQFGFPYIDSLKIQG